MKGTLEAKAEVTVAAPVATVWRGLTDPSIVRQYFFGTELDAEWKVGGSIFFRGSWEGRSYEDRGTILAIDPPRLLRFSYWSSLSGTPDLPENYASVTYELAESAGRTVVTVTQDCVESEESRDHSAANWRMVLDGMRKIVEADAAP